MTERLDLQGRHVVLGLSGGIACYKSADLARELVKAGATVQVVMTESACRFITPVTMQALTGRPVITDPWDARAPANMAHIDLSREADAIVIAPASADLIAARQRLPASAPSRQSPAGVPTAAACCPAGRSVLGLPLPVARLAVWPGVAGRRCPARWTR